MDRWSRQIYDDEIPTDLERPNLGFFPDTHDLNCLHFTVSTLYLRLPTRILSDIHKRDHLIVFIIVWILDLTLVSVPDISIAILKIHLIIR